MARQLDLVGDVPDFHASGDASPDGSLAFAEREKVLSLLEAAQAGNVGAFLGAAQQFESASEISEVRDGQGRTALHFAAQLGHVELCRRLLEEFECHVDSGDDEGTTPLQLACASGQLSTVDLLIEYGSDIKTIKVGGAQPVHQAAASGCVPVLERLLQGGADVNAPSDTGPPLIWAAGSGKAETISTLLSHGANPLVSNLENVTPAIMAAAAGHVPALKILLARGADPKVKAKGGITALHVGAACVIEDTALQIVEALLESGAEAWAEDDSGLYPIHSAAQEGNRSSVSRLLEVRPLPESCKDWTVDSVMASFSIAETQPTGSASCPEILIPEVSEPDEQQAGALKRKGDEAYGKDLPQEAVEFYTQALSHWTHNALIWANRAAAYLKLGKPSDALEDARRSRTLDPGYAKAWYREGLALRDLRQWEDAACAFFEGLRLAPENLEIARSFQNAIEEGKKAHVQNKGEPDD